jgi:PhnB protein
LPVADDFSSARRPNDRDERQQGIETVKGGSAMELNAYVNFAGKCAEAFRYYEHHLDGRIEMMMTHGEAPGPTPLDDGWKDAVLHARIVIDGTALLGADIPNAEPMRSAYLTLGVDSDGEAERLYAALSDGGRVLMRMEETFFASRFGQVQDRFGINWMILHQRGLPASG